MWYYFLVFKSVFLNRLIELFWESFDFGRDVFVVEKDFLYILFDIIMNKIWKIYMLNKNILVKYV